MGERRKKVTGGVHTRSQVAAKEAKAAATKLARTERASAAANRNVAAHPGTRGRSAWTRDPFANLPDAFVADLAQRVTAAPGDQQSNARALLTMNRATSARMQGMLSDRFDRARVGLLVGLLRCAHRLYGKKDDGNSDDIKFLWRVSQSLEDEVEVRFVPDLQVVVTSPSLRYNRYIDILPADQVRALAAAVEGAMVADRGPLMEWWDAMLSSVPNLQQVWDAVKKRQIIERMLVNGHKTTLSVNFYKVGELDISLHHQHRIQGPEFHLGSIAYEGADTMYVNHESFDGFCDKICALAPPFRIPVDLLNIGACVGAFAAVLKGPEKDWPRGVMQMRFPKVACARKQK